MKRDIPPRRVRSKRHNWRSTREIEKAGIPAIQSKQGLGTFVAKDLYPGIVSENDTYFLRLRKSCCIPLDDVS